MTQHSLIMQLYCQKFSHKSVDISKCYARKQKRCFSLKHDTVNTTYLMDKMFAL